MKNAKTLLFFLCYFFTAVLIAQNTAPTYVADEVLVEFKPTISKTNTQNIRSEITGLSVQHLGNTKIEQWTLPPTIFINNIYFDDVEQVITYYSNHSDIEVIEPNYIVGASLSSNDPSLNQLWGLDNTGQTGGLADADIDATEAWEIRKESPNIKIGVIDTGIDWRHPDLVDNIWQNLGEDADGDGQVIVWNGSAWTFDPDDENGIDDDGNGYIDDFVGWDFRNNDNDPFDDHGHGTHVAGTIGAEGNNSEGITGVTWKVQLAGLKFLSSGGSGNIADAIEAINYATLMGFNLTNNSWGGSNYSVLTYNAIDDANNAGQLFVAAAGNSGLNNDTYTHYPSFYNLPNVISVAATNDQDNLAYFSNYGATSVDIAAPGEDILSCVPNNGYDSYSGTSMATSYIAGAIALIWENCNAINHLQVKDLLFNSVDVIAGVTGKCVTNGRLNLLTSLQNDDGTAEFAYNVTGLSVDFTANYTDGDTYTWDFGDGNSSTSQNPSYTYTSPGSYSVQLTVVNNCASYEHTEIVQLDALCDASFSIISSSGANDNSICQNDIGTFTNTTPGAISSEWKINNVVVSYSSSFDYVFAEVGLVIVNLYTITDIDECYICEEVTIHSNARNLFLGEDIYVCEDSITLDSELPGMAAYLWDFNGDPFSSGSSMLTVHQSGTYRLTVIDHCDQIETDEIEVSLEECENVWPGNVNDDGRVDNLDALSLIIKAYKSGLVRQNASPEWFPQFVEDWLDTEPDGVDAKHADCDGNGFVDPNIDGEVIELNYGKIKIATLSNPVYPTNDFRLIARKSDVQILGTDRNIVFDLILRNTTNQSLDYVGVAFSADFVNGINPFLNSSESEIGQDDNLFTFFKLLPNNRIEGAIGRVDGNNFSQAPHSGRLVTRLIIDEEIITGTGSNLVQLYLENIVLIDNQGELTNLVTSTASATSGEEVVLLNNEELLSVATFATQALDCPTGGSATAYVEGGTPPYTYIWENGQTTDTNTPLYPGSYQVTVSDAVGEQAVSTVFVPGTISCSESLPLEWLSFKVTPKKSTIDLNWMTTNEQNIQYFEVERSEDGTHFSTIGITTAKGEPTMSNLYQWTDNAVHFNTTYYYRIKSVEINRSYFSIVQSAQLVQLLDTDIIIQPNPTQDIATILLAQKSTNPVQVSIFNRLGQELHQDVFYNEQTINLNLKKYSSGIYFIVLRQDGQEHTFKIVKE